MNMILLFMLIFICTVVLAAPSGHCNNAAPNPVWGNPFWGFRRRNTRRRRRRRRWGGQKKATAFVGWGSYKRRRCGRRVYRRNLDEDSDDFKEELQAFDGEKKVSFFGGKLRALSEDSEEEEVSDETPEEEQQVAFWSRRRGRRRNPWKFISKRRRKSKMCCKALTPACILCATGKLPVKLPPRIPQKWLRGRRELLEVELSEEEEQLADFLNSASEDQIANIFSEEELSETEGMSEEEVSDWLFKNLWKKIKKAGSSAGKWGSKAWKSTKKKVSTWKSF